MESCGGLSWRDLLEKPEDVSDFEPEIRTDGSGTVKRRCDGSASVEASMHEEDFWSSWLREDKKSKEERKAEAEGEGEEEGEKRKRNEEKEENETGTVNEDVRVWFLWKPLKFSVKSEMWRVAGMFPAKTSWTILRTCLIVSMVLVLMSVWCLMCLTCLFPLPLWSPSFVMVSLVARIRILWNRSPFLSPKSEQIFGTSTQEEMRYESSQVQAPQMSRRKMMPPTPLQNSYTSSEREQVRYEEEGRGWNARERAIIKRTKQYLERSFSVKVRVEELEGLLGADDIDADFRRILKEARDEKGCAIFETWWSVVREGTSTEGSGTHLGDKIRLRAWKSRELV